MLFAEEKFHCCYPPLEQRLVFLLRESLHIVFHETLAKAILAVNPTGMEFINIETDGKPLEVN